MSMTCLRILLHGKVVFERSAQDPTSLPQPIMKQCQSTEPLPRPTTPRRIKVLIDDQSLNPGSFTIQRSVSNKEKLDPGMFARDRNPRRTATKLFGNVPTPKSQRQTKSTTAAVSTPQPNEASSARSKKRKPQQDCPPSTSKRRSKTGQFLSKAAMQLAGETMDAATAPHPGGMSEAATLQSQEGLPQDLFKHDMTPREHTVEAPEHTITRKQTTTPDHTAAALPLLCASTPKLPPDNHPPENIIRKPGGGFDVSPALDKAVEGLHKAQRSLEVAAKPPAVNVQGFSQPRKTDFTTYEHVFQANLLPTPRTQGPLPDARSMPASSHPLRAECCHETQELLPKPPAINEDASVEYVEQMKALLHEKSLARSQTVATRQAGRILSLLEIAKPANQNDAVFMSGYEAAKHLSSRPTDIFVTEGQQLMPLQTIKQFLDEYYDDDTKVWIQDPSVELLGTLPSVREVTMGQIKTRFATPVPNQEPWNLLELATHCEDGLRPVFLNHEDCRLLTKLKIPNSAKEARRRTYSPGYKEVEKWALLAQAGALTEPHQDSHGYGTFITLNVGKIGFGWLSRPTDADREGWCASPHDYLGGNWRYIILNPGQTVYFPPGTVHFVFRHPSAGDSLAFGGHVLRCSTLVSWIKTILEEKRHPSITNEDITQSAPGYLSQVEKFVIQALKSGDEARIRKWGGKAEIKEFLRLKKEFSKK